MRKPMTDLEYKAEKARLTQALEELERQHAAAQQPASPVAVPAVSIDERMPQLKAVMDDLGRLLQTDLGRADKDKLDGLLERGKEFVRTCQGELGAAVLDVLNQGEGLETLQKKTDALSAQAARFSVSRRPPASPVAGKGFSLSSCLRYVFCCGCCPGGSAADDEDGMSYQRLSGGGPKR
ncbi:MAG: hypothetical protein P1U40_10180 [Coxiellaceae bacterium]|nr:hypothetical protein [Coxiellaceae bacterium]